MEAGCVPAFILATWPSPFRGALLVLVAMSLGCVNLKQPWALAHPDGGAGGSPARGSATSTIISGSGGAGSGPASSGGTAGASGTVGTDTQGGARGGATADGGTGLGGTTIPSSNGLDAKGSGGQSEIDAAAGLPQGTGGRGSDTGTGGSGAGGTGGRSGVVGGSGTRLDAGAGGSGAGRTAGPSGGAGSGGSGPDAGGGGSGAGRTAGAAGTVGADGAAGQDGGETGGVDVRDAALAVDASSPDSPCALCALGTALVHRYNFNGTGPRVTDTVGTAHGMVMNAQLSGSGTVVLAGGTTDQYVDLPDSILSTLTSATLEIWVTWTGGNNNQRILDFGSNEQVDGRYHATTTVIISPNSVPEGTTPRLRASYSNEVSITGTFVDAPSALTTAAVAQIVAVFDGQSHTLSLYLNGVLQGQTTGLEALSLIKDNNNWLGKSQYTNDPGFQGTYHEFRIYKAPLTAEQVQAVYAAGQNASFSQ